MSKSGPPPDSEDAGRITRETLQTRTEVPPPTQPLVQYPPQQQPAGYLPQVAYPQPSYLQQPQPGYHNVQANYIQQPVQFHGQTGAPRVPHQAHVTVTSIKSEEKSIVDAYVLCFALGFLGAHHLYLRRPWFFVAYFFTLGLFGVGWVVDMCRIPCLVKETNARIRDASREQTKEKMDAYLLWFPCGLFGFHLFYLNRPGQGLLYFFTFGLLGIGWLVDLFRIPYMVKDCNKEANLKVHTEKSMFASCVLCYSPLGILGAHHYYLNRPFWGLLYTCTFGLLGVGWIVDWCRCYHLVIRAREEELGVRDKGMKYYDDIYLLWFPFGLVGMHHFYLRRYVWGFLYFCTFGLFGIGFIIDFCRLPCLVKDYNKHLSENRILAKSAQEQLNGHLNSRVTGDTLVTTNLAGGSIVTPQPYGCYGATAPQPQGAPGAPYVTQVMTYPQYGIIHPQSGYQAGQFQPNQLPNTVILPPPNQNGMMYPPTYEEATNDTVTSQDRKGE